MTRLAIRGVTCLPMDDAFSTLENADILIEDGRIRAIGPNAAQALPEGDDLDTLDGTGLIALPGFVQTHIHLCQTLFRNLADDLVLIDWLKQRIWPLEAAHSHASLRASADLGLAELIRSGTTTLLDMGTVNHTDAIGEAVAASGVRAFIGKCMMDWGDELPDGLREETRASLRESEALYHRWEGQAEGLIRYAFCPRFALSCSTELLREVGAMAADLGAFIHTHSSETEFEIEETLRLHGKRNVAYLHDCGMTGARSVFAHGVWLDDGARKILKDTETAIAHCPSSNLKLGSGIANIPLLMKLGIKVGLGADGAPCNNTLDAFTEMRRAALIQKPIHGPTAMPAQDVLRLATMGGARSLGLEDEIGSLEVGKRADIILLRLNRPHNGVGGSLASRIVYAAYPENVDTVIVEGRILMERGELLSLDEEATRAHATEALTDLVERSGI